MPLTSEDVMSMNTNLTDALPEGAWEIPLSKGQPPTSPGRTIAMFEVRESDQHDHLLFDGMRQQTYEPYRDNPWVRAVLAAGLAPLRASGTHAFTVRFDDGTSIRLEVLIEQITRGRTSVTRFQVGPYVHLWSMASAASMNTDGDNDFTSVLIDEVRSTRPQLVIAANISRLVRSDQEGGLLLKVLPDHVDEVWAGPVVLKLVGEGSEYGRMLFSVLGAVAAMERNWIVTRMMAGRIAAWRRGEWLFGETTTPFGYRLEDRRLVPVPELRDQVRQMLLLLGDDVAPSLTVRRLADLDVPTFRRSSSKVIGDSTRARNNPRALVDSFLAWVPLWVAGEYIWRFTSPMKGVREFAGAPVVYADGHSAGSGEVQLLMTPGVPPGGWAEQDVLDRVALAARTRFGSQLATRSREPEMPLAQAVRCRSTDPDLHEAVLGVNNEGRRPPVRNPRRRGTRTAALFSGYGWGDGVGTYELKVHPHGRYAIVRREIQSPRNSPGAESTR